jgi:transposase
MSDAEWGYVKARLPAVSKDGRREKHDRRDIVDALLYVTHNGIVWRALPADFPPWKTVYGFFDRWKKKGVTITVHDGLRDELRQAEGRATEPTAGERVFGRSRVTLLTAELASYDDRAAQERTAERGRLQRKIDDLARRQDNLLRQAQDGDPADPFTQGLRRNYNELEAERTATLSKIKDLDAADEAEPDRPGPTVSPSSMPYRRSSSSSTRPPRHCNDASTRSRSSPSTSTTKDKRYR